MRAMQFGRSWWRVEDQRGRFLAMGRTKREALARARDRDRHPEGDETRSGSVERSEIEPGPLAASPKSCAPKTSQSINPEPPQQ